MDLTFRTLGAWGAGKGANLEASEVDTNFWNLAEAIYALQANPAVPNGIATITVSGTQMTITLHDGTVLGPYTLPVLTFRWRGEWTPSTTYAELDTFTVSTANGAVDPLTVRYGIFMVLIGHTSPSIFNPDQTDGSGNPVLQQLFGSTDTLLKTLGDVSIDQPPGSNPLVDGQVLRFDTTSVKWINRTLGSMATQNSNTVTITGGTITGIGTPIQPFDVVNKAYVDALPEGMATPDGSMLANIAGITGPAIAHTLSDYLDHVLLTTVRGTMLFRGGAGWIALPPGTAGLFLQTAGAGADPTWQVGAAGVTSITAGTGIDTGGAPIINTGTVALHTIADSDFLANISGVTAAPTPTTLSAFLDHVLSNARGQILTRNISGWVALAPGTSGYFLKTQGTGADLMWDAPVGSGTVTSISAGTGLTTGGAPITATGTILLASVADSSILANISGATAAPIANTLTLIMDHVLGATQGDVLYRSATTWVVLAPGTSGQILTTGGAAANPSWQNAPTTGGSIGNGQIVSNILGHTAVPVGNSLSNVFDSIVGSARGTLFFRTNSGWVGLAPGLAGQVLTTGGSTADPTWVTNGGGNIGIASPAAQDTLAYNPASGRFENVRPKYVIGAYTPGVMAAASQNLLYHKFSKAVTLPANLGVYLGHTTEAGGSAAATGSTAIVLARALAGTPTSFATVATITFAAGSVTGTMSTQAAITFAQGDVLRVRGPATPDATFSDFHMTLVGYET
jgi:hypothetical protein